MRIVKKCKLLCIFRFGTESFIRNIAEGKEDCWDNAVAESFFHTLKTELIHHEIYHTKEQAKRSIFEYIEVFYNRERSHSTNNNLSPVKFEEKMLRLEMVS